MNCFSHHETEAVALCAHCGKGLCEECASRSASGRWVCSRACALARGTRRPALHPLFLHCLSGGLLLAGVFYLAHGVWQLSVFLGLAALISWRVARRVRWEGEFGPGFSWVCYRAGDAMEKAHRFRQLVAELLTLHARFSTTPFSLTELDGADRERRVEILSLVYSEAQRKVVGKLSEREIHESARGDADDIDFCHHLAEDYFELHAKDLRTLRGRVRLAKKLFDAHMPLRENITWLSGLNRQLAKTLSQTEMK
jgi:hypothetical protein